MLCSQSLFCMKWLWGECMKWGECCKVIISLHIVPAVSVPLTWLNALCFEIRSRALHLVACQRTVRFCWHIVRLTNILLLFRTVRIQFIKANSLLFRTLVYNSGHSFRSMCLVIAGVANQSETKSHISYCVTGKSLIIHMVGTHERSPIASSLTHILLLS